MSPDFTAAYTVLNDAQRQAVDTIDGPLLVLAGPGTGKTQLLSTRAANIILKAGVAPENLLCLTYTDVGAAQMRARLTNIMGPAGGDVAVYTFHGLGNWLIGQYPERFSREKALKQLDELGRYHILNELLGSLPLRHALAIRDEQGRFIRRHSVQAAIDAFKKAGYLPDRLREILRSNQTAYHRLQPLFDELFGTTLSAKRLPAINDAVDGYSAETVDGSYENLLLQSLSQAVAVSIESGKTTELGAWRTRQLTVKDGKKILKDEAQHQLLSDTIKLYEDYQLLLQERGRYDYEDMILWAIDALEGTEDIRLDVAERFQYIMVDEYQDTNGAQNRLLDAILSANPLDSPNIMCVGDDDQAIMRFQGAESSGMQAFVQRYRPQIIPLTDNYRSGQALLDAARQIIIQTDERLEVSLPEYQLSKVLQARTKPSQPTLQHEQYSSPAAQYTAVCNRIDKLIAAGARPDSIGVIARKHSELATFVPYLHARGIEVQYDRKENILEDDAILDLLRLAEYLVLQNDRPKRAAAMLPAILTAPYWQLEPIELYTIAASARDRELSWLDAMLLSDNDNWQAIANWLIASALRLPLLNFTQALDIVLGRESLDGQPPSPYRRSYDGQEPGQYIGLLSKLIRIRRAVLEARPAARSLQDMLDVVNDYQHSDIRLLDDNPLLRGGAGSVQLMSAHGSKGREFEHVIILSAVDEVWGNRARSNNQQIRLPATLPLYPAGDAESDKLRLLYVAITRAKSDLLLSSYTQNEAGKASTPLSFLALGDSEDGWWQPLAKQLDAAQTAQAIEHTWRPPDLTAPSLQTMLQPVLERFRLSPTALRDFLDIRYAGPRACIERHILGFPSAYNAHSALGSATHDVIEAAHAAFKAGRPLNEQAIIAAFDERLDASGLEATELSSVRIHGHDFLPRFIQAFTDSDFADISQTEQFLTAMLPGPGVPLNGKLDAIIETSSTLRVVDYKTGTAPAAGWNPAKLTDSKQVSLHFYRQQLLFYKLLVDNSHTYAGKRRVDAADLIFVEGNDQDEAFVRLTIDSFSQADIQQTEALVQAVYRRITLADIPDTSIYRPDLKGIIAFEADLLK